MKFKITIEGDSSAVLDFAGAGEEGCLSPIDAKIPRPSILDPTKAAAVLGGNVTRSQRVTDVLLKPLQACAASQGCLNNLTFRIGAKVDEATG
ncbi:hypothetical protein DL766_008888 [Monosporascus sp. MC13-8B]|uniref:Hydantoinase B/oxoprolinase domain-containing protein n=1 Tax=Monosporascus cannonballus TaxID=155416 RepID=A0ABY0GWU0_9PEZI|nr:hypothetical protein DL762_008595 [Monosporascus cannonballus]RYO98933.1 hypothetical protein DL763_001843 [Monosporascus cannonballus]RYP17473.1 hypothetical protein DL766_008888 [Monosporascus sp. MC13-8B]